MLVNQNFNVGELQSNLSFNYKSTIEFQTKLEKKEKIKRTGERSVPPSVFPFTLNTPHSSSIHTLPPFTFPAKTPVTTPLFPRNSTRMSSTFPNHATVNPQRTFRSVQFKIKNDLKSQTTFLEIEKLFLFIPCDSVNSNRAQKLFQLAVATAANNHKALMI